ncbi:hypothetical protein pipiens_010093 [Culex pipiens pipiens]|uniref:Uncharacterized protein n=1 Tax=Culex pipiens pipiens TaxID=38569 RepID=A0ABD1DBR1_CULPP
MALRQDTYHNWDDLMNIGTWIQIKKGYLLEIQAPTTRLTPLPELTGDTVDAPSLSVFLSTSTGSSIAEELVATSTSGAGSLQQLTTLADDVSDSADSEYRSLETKDDDDDDDYCLE